MKDTGPLTQCRLKCFLSSSMMVLLFNINLHFSEWHLTVKQHTICRALIYCPETERLHLSDVSHDYDHDGRRHRGLCCSSLLFLLCVSLFLILSPFIFLSSPPLPPTYSHTVQRSAVMHTMALCPCVRWGQLIDDANSKVALPLR